MLFCHLLIFVQNRLIHTKKNLECHQSAEQFVGPDLGLICLQRASEGNKRGHWLIKCK